MIRHCWKFWKISLRAKGYLVTARRDATDIQQIFDHVEPELVITDYRLNGPSGEDVCRCTREKFAGLPIILVSGWPRTPEIVKPELFNIFIPKPFDLWNFLACVRELIQLNSLRRPAV